MTERVNISRRAAFRQCVLFALILVSLFYGRQKSLTYYYYNMNCPSDCKCRISKQSFVINCSDSQQARVPDFSPIHLPPTIREVDLYLSGNNLFHLLRSSLAPFDGKIKTLEIENNKNEIDIASSIFDDNKDSLRVVKLGNVSGKTEEILGVLSSLDRIQELTLHPHDCLPVRIETLLAYFLDAKTMATASFHHCGIIFSQGRFDLDISNISSVDVFSLPPPGRQTGNENAAPLPVNVVFIDLEASEDSRKNFVLTRVMAVHYEDKVTKCQGRSEANGRDSNSKQATPFDYYVKLNSDGCLYLHVQNITKYERSKEVTSETHERDSRDDSENIGGSDFKPTKMSHNNAPMNSMNDSSMIPYAFNWKATLTPHPRVNTCRCRTFLKKNAEVRNTHSKYRVCRNSHGRVISLDIFILKCLLSPDTVHSVNNAARDTFYRTLRQSMVAASKGNSRANVAMTRYTARSQRTRDKPNAATIVIIRTSAEHDDVMIHTSAENDDVASRPTTTTSMADEPFVGRHDRMKKMATTLKSKRTDLKGRAQTLSHAAVPPLEKMTGVSSASKTRRGVSPSGRLGRDDIGQSAPRVTSRRKSIPPRSRTLGLFQGRKCIPSSPTSPRHGCLDDNVIPRTKATSTSTGSTGTDHFDVDVDVDGSTGISCTCARKQVEKASQYSRVPYIRLRHHRVNKAKSVLDPNWSTMQKCDHDNDTRSTTDRESTLRIRIRKLLAERRDERPPSPPPLTQRSKTSGAPEGRHSPPARPHQSVKSGVFSAGSVVVFLFCVVHTVLIWAVINCKRLGLRLKV